MSYLNGQRHAHTWRLNRRRQKDAGPPFHFFWTCHCTAVKTVILFLDAKSGKLTRKAYVTTDDGIEACGPAAPVVAPVGEKIESEAFLARDKSEVSTET